MVWLSQQKPLCDGGPPACRKGQGKVKGREEKGSSLPLLFSQALACTMCESCAVFTSGRTCVTVEMSSARNSCESAKVKFKIQVETNLSWCCFPNRSFRGAFLAGVPARCARRSRRCGRLPWATDIQHVTRHQYLEALNF